MTFFSAKRKNEEILALQIVKGFGFSNKGAEEAARFKQPLHIWYKNQSEVNNTQVTDFWDNISVPNLNLKNKFYACR